jgi:hypothetical protein
MARWSSVRSRYGERKGRGRLPRALTRGYWDAEAARGKGERRRKGGSRRGQGRMGRREVEERLDRWAPPVSRRVREGRGVGR